MWKTNGFHGANSIACVFLFILLPAIARIVSPNEWEVQIAGKNIRKFLKVQFCKVCVAPKQYD